MEFSRFFTDDQVKTVHEKSIELLEETGVDVNHPKARKYFADAGCIVDEGTHRVKIPRAVIEKAMETFTSSYTFKAQDPKFDVTLPGDRPVFVTASSGPNVIDPKTGEERRGTSEDIANLAYLINELEGFDVFSISTLADDAPEGQFSISRFYPALKNCKKPVRSNTPSLEELKDVLDLGYLIAGGEDKYKERPFINHHYCPMISPLVMEVDSADCCMYLVEQGLPVYCTLVPNGGLSSPMTMMGTLLMTNAEFLTINTLFQIIRPGHPTMFACLPTIADMRTGDYVSGAMETAMLQMGVSEMAKFYNVATGGYIGLTNSQMNDAQAGYESGMNSTACFLAGCDLFNMGGLLGGLMAVDYGKILTDNEIALRLKRLKKGMEYSEENFYMDLIKEIGPGGDDYMSHETTAELMFETLLMRELPNTGNRAIWKEQGGGDFQEKAMAKAREILGSAEQRTFGPEIEAKIDERFPGHVKGDIKYE